MKKPKTKKKKREKTPWEVCHETHHIREYLKGGKNVHAKNKKEK